MAFEKICNRVSTTALPQLPHPCALCNVTLALAFDEAMAVATAGLGPVPPAQAMVDGVSSTLRRRLCMAVVRLRGSKFLQCDTASARAFLLASAVSCRAPELSGHPMPCPQLGMQQAILVNDDDSGGSLCQVRPRSSLVAWIRRGRGGRMHHVTHASHTARVSQHLPQPTDLQLHRLTAWVTSNLACLEAVGGGVSSCGCAGLAAAESVPRAAQVWLPEVGDDGVRVLRTKARSNPAFSHGSWAMTAGHPPSDASIAAHVALFASAPQHMHL